MKLLGNRVLLIVPRKEETKLILDHNTKEDLQKEMLKKMSKLEVHSVGDTVNTFKTGDIVLVDPMALNKAVLIDISPEKQVLLVSVFDVVLVW